MDDKILDAYLKAYGRETDQEVSFGLKEKFLSLPDCATQDVFAQDHKVWTINPYAWFDFMMPKAIGWTLACCIGIYFGLSTSDQASQYMDEEYYMYNAAQLILSENLTIEDKNND
ncbi:MAG: hypothetical protein K9G26_09615 [Emcibacter sp.]|nr:hypothetical protein [Emcibacter sp.]